MTLSARIRSLPLFLWVGLVSGGAVAQDESKMLQGVWRGGPSNGKEKIEYEVTITADRISAKDPKSGRLIGEGTYKVDPVEKTIDVLGTARDYKGKTYLGIWSFEGKVLKWCTGNANGPRATKFVQDQKIEHYLLVLERAP